MSRLKLWFLIVLLFAGSVTVLSLTESAAISDPSPAANKDSAAIQTVKMSEAAALPETEPQESGVLPPGTDPQNALGWSFVKHLASDQRAFWKSGRDLGRGDAKAFGTFAGFTALLIASDSWLAKQVPDKPSQLRRSNHLSQYAAYSLARAVGGSFFWGHLTKNDHLLETGLLSGEALLNSTAATYAFRGITQRARPFDGDGTGKFFQRGSSFPSEHSVDAWSVASVMAHEYPGPLTKFIAYGLASAVTMTRVTSKQHFASDAFVGSALGWYVGRRVYHAHHDPELGGGPWGSLLEKTGEASRKPENMGSPHVPLDSWVYPAFARLAALGYVQTAFLGVRPWTRMECARLLEEAGDQLTYDGEPDSEAQRVYQALADEFALEAGRLDGDPNLEASVDSIYSRVSGISGPALRDGYHFGQTIVNDYGRPYGEGFNAVTGVTAHAVAGPLWLSLEGEYQHAPATASDRPNALAATAKEDGAVPLPNGSSTVNRLRLLTATVGITARNIRFYFGRESAWLGPGEAGPLLFSDNAAPITALRIDSASPRKVPLLSRWLGSARTELFLGQLSGHHWVFANDHLVGPRINPQPFIHGDKISFKPTANLEFGMGITAVFGGPGLPFTWGNFLRTYYSHKASVAQNPGKRFSAFDFTYRVPGLRKWLTLYNDSLVVDEYSPIGSTRPTLNPGLYLPQIPKIPKLDFRVEALRSARDRKFGPGYVYADVRYRSGYTSGGTLLASWIGRAGTGMQAWSSYWFSPRNRLQLEFRHLGVERTFLEGGYLNDLGARGEVLLRSNLACAASFQYERWEFPLLSSQPKSNLTVSFQLTLLPHWRIR